MKTMIGRARGQGLIVTVVLAGVLYNAVLAVMNVHGFVQSFLSVAVTEAVILILAVYRVIPGFTWRDRVPLLYAAFSILIMLYMSVVGDHIFLDSLRNSLIIVVFILLGHRSSERTIILSFRCVSLIVGAFLILEVLSTEAYVAVLGPAQYYLNTRGIEEFSLDQSGLFRNALGFEDRFSFGISSHRTASIFIEQVSLANFCTVLVIYISTMIGRLGIADFILHSSLLLFALLTNDSRTSSALVALFVLGYRIFPRLKASLVPYIMPLTLLCAAMQKVANPDAVGDNVGGRFNLTIDNLIRFGVEDYLGFNSSHVASYMDSGYAYVIESSSVLGFLGMWLFVIYCVRGSFPTSRRLLYLVNIYIFSNLVIGGTAMFSIKVAAPLWLLVGFVARLEAEHSTPRSDQLS